MHPIRSWCLVHSPQLWEVLVSALRNIPCSYLCQEFQNLSWKHANTACMLCQSAPPMATHR